METGVAGEKLQSHEGESSNRGAEGKVERFTHRGLVMTSTHQRERVVCTPAGRGGWGLGAEARAIARREYGKESGPA